MPQPNQPNQRRQQTLPNQSQSRAGDDFCIMVQNVQEQCHSVVLENRLQLACPTTRHVCIINSEAHK